MDVWTIVWLLEIFSAFLLVAGAGVLLWLVFLAIPGLVQGPPFVAMKPAVLEEFMAAADIRPGEKVIELGSGDGRVLAEAVRAGAAATGYDINLFLVWRSRWRLWRTGRSKNAKVAWSDFWRADLSGADAVLIWGFKPVMERLEKKLDKELKPGARFIAYQCGLPNWRPERVVGQTYVYRRAPPGPAV